MQPPLKLIEVKANIIQMLADIPTPQKDLNLEQLLEAKTITKRIKTYTLKYLGHIQRSSHRDDLQL